MLMHLQSVVEANFPHAELLFKWHLPFYYLHKKPFCYLNQSKDYVDVAFFHKGRLKAYQKELVSEHRKVVSSLRYRALEAIDDRLLVEILHLVNPEYSQRSN